MVLRDDDIARLRAAVLADDTFAARFELIAEAGSGGMGQVFEAIDRETGARVAVKLLAATADRARFAAEAEILERLEHPAIVRYVRHGVTGRGEPYLAMEWLPGENLAQRLARRPLDALDAAVLGERVAGALAHAHAAGIVHRDLKPSNIFLVDGRVDRARVIDFGVAKLANRDLTRTGQMIGTPGYMAPEQVRGERGIDGRVDLFALGCVLHEALSGRRPFDGAEVMEVLARLLLEQPPRLDALVPARLAHLIAALLAKDPARRIADAEIVRDELAAIRTALAAGDTAALARRSTAIPESTDPALAEAATLDVRPPPQRRPRRAIGLAIGAGAGLAIAGVMIVVLARRDTAAPCTQDDYAGCAEHCAAGDATACERRGRSLSSGRGAAVDRPAAVVAYTRACELGATSSCGIAAALILRDIDEGARPGDQRAEASRLLASGCEHGVGQACLKLAHLYLPADPPRALAVLAKGCGIDDHSACTELRDTIDQVTDVPARAAASDVLRAACARRPRASYCTPGTQSPSP